MNENFIVIIPARFASSRFPGKALADINNKPMVMHVYENAKKKFDQVFVATDHEDIRKVVIRAGGQAILTGDHHSSGTERCAEAILKTGLSIDHNTVVINLQGDEPLLEPQLLESLANQFNQPEVEIATLVHPIETDSDLENPHRVKVVLDLQQRAIDFTRDRIRCMAKNNNEIRQINCLLHLGIYAFRLPILQEIVALPPTKNEQAASLEQLRWLDHGYQIHCSIVDYQGHGVDTPEDLELIKMHFK